MIDVLLILRIKPKLSMMNVSNRLNNKVNLITSKLHRKYVSLAKNTGLFYRQGTQKNILLFSSRRGGSTFLAELVSCNPGILHIDQPFDLFKPNTITGKIKDLPHVPRSQFISVSDTEEPKIFNYTNLLLNGKLQKLGMIEKAKFPILTNRTILKICNASSLVDWFNDNFDVIIIHLLRHPISQSLSIVRNNWGITAKAYLANKFFANNYLNQEQINFSKNILESGTYFEQAILNWVFENLVILKYSKANKLRLFYELLVTDSEKQINILSQYLNISGTLMKEKLNKPSASSSHSDKKTTLAIKNENRDYLISKWQNIVSPEQIVQAQKILDIYEIGEYKATESLPQI